MLLSRYDVKIIQENYQASKYLTGLSWKVFDTLCKFITPQMLKPCTNLPLRRQIFMVLVRLHLDIPFGFLSYQTGLSQSTVHLTSHKIINILYTRLKFLVRWPDRDHIRETVPPTFKHNFPKLTSIIDCFEIFIERPKI